MWEGGSFWDVMPRAVHTVSLSALGCIRDSEGRCSDCGGCKAPEGRAVSRMEIQIRKGSDCSEIKESKTSGI